MVMLCGEITMALWTGHAGDYVSQENGGATGWPGHRHLRWSAVMVRPNEWKWLERGSMGTL